jgi:MFS family permease
VIAPDRRRFYILLAAITLITGGEELWARYIPNYLQALGASVLAVAAYGTLHDLLDALYQLPGGAITARLGSTRSLVVFNGLAIAGYVAYAVAHVWWVVLAALPLVMAWESFSLPATFSIVAEQLPRGERSMGFALQSIVRRLPILVAPVLGGALLAAYGAIAGVRYAIAIGIILALAAAILQSRSPRRAGSEPTLSLRESLADVMQLDPVLRRLLVSDILVRFGEGIAEIFVVLYVVKVLGASPATFGWLVALAMLTSIVSYIPAARSADAGARKPWVALTYAFFAAFPLVLALTRSAALLPLAFLCMGLREIGEPPRKAMIVDLARPGRKSVDVGAYYLVRNLAVFPAALVGGLLWRVAPSLTFLTAAAVAAIGVMTLILGVRDIDRAGRRA